MGEENAGDGGSRAGYFFLEPHEEKEIMVLFSICLDPRQRWVLLDFDQLGIHLRLAGEPKMVCQLIEVQRQQNSFLSGEDLCWRGVLIRKHSHNEKRGFCENEIPPAGFVE